ncbi:SDR family oxidoreductase [Pseudomonas sp. ABC1]|uniref:SDR family NAD(P)-dependent oxidoreductase n=1 Tax=Pseudomonas sp. ABC1 TaxID=2748080 RepID=UPI0015C2DBFA|nr:SDR family oxidoreductase [Pseudomonas sp. ABC1]QLF92479.1 SDR family oxidoreductase [Pseudomonas sp. ABC1]
MNNLPSSVFSLHGKMILINGIDSSPGRYISEACMQRGATIMHAPHPGQLIHGLVHCVDEPSWQEVADLDVSCLTRVLQANLVQPVMLTQQLLQGSMANKASIVFLLSAARGERGRGAYAASKAGLLGIIRCLALEQAGHGIRVNGISSRLDESVWPDIANTITFLLSDASRWITGINLPVNGGGTV